MSLGSIVDKILVEPEGTALLKGKPSKIINGSFDAFKDEPPRIRISAFAPGAPPPVTFTPEIRPLIKLSGVTFCPLLNSLAEICDTEPVASFFFTVP